MASLSRGHLGKTIVCEGECVSDPSTEMNISEGSEGKIHGGAEGWGKSLFEKIIFMVAKENEGSAAETYQAFGVEAIVAEHLGEAQEPGKSC